MSQSVPPPLPPELLPPPATAAAAMQREALLPPPAAGGRDPLLRGCLLALTGSVGCLFLIVALLVGAVIATGQTIGGFVNGFAGLFGGSNLIMVDTSRIYVPQVERIKQLTQLTTVRFSYASIVTSQSDMPALLQTLYGQSLVMVAVGHIQAGINLETLTADDVRYDEDSRIVTITLPPPTLLECFLNEAQSYVVERSSGVFAPDALTLDTTSRRFALQQFRAQALEEGILTQAQERAETALRELFTVFNDPATAPEIRFVVRPDGPAAPPPETCQ
ncbi:MAG: DUF4230 domain-containing protein [Anaerolineae bacterium]|jgi:hypothetical protein|nr:DUF4230 domain-containing protein [Anaerolineae bacterium]